ncbi:MAG: adenosylmethionine--8-amino-7-oxononanoate transaminase [Candidatus Omnitrophica bacterium]|nr:adenosylmethionine--8-amino-7-oxononanoate transaminase [Candidatus Omnitrophota bacterium]
MDRWIKKDLKYNWHPYTQMKDSRKDPPILIERAKGIKLYDNRGKYYYDTISSWWCNVHGHNHPKIKKAIKKQLDSLEHVLFAGFTHKPAIQLAEQLVRIAPGNLSKVFFTDNGSCAVETALKMSFQYWQNLGEKKKTKFISLSHGYHGDTIGSMSISGVDLFNEVFKPLFFKSFKAPSPYCYRCPMGKRRAKCNIECIEPLDDLLKKREHEIAALILEPLIMAAGGMIIYPKEYLKKAAALTKKYNVHLILDEVATGFGRTGKMFASEHARVKPDFMCVSKGITSGYLPLGATLTTREVFQAFWADYEKKKTFYHGHTYTANPLACSTALASLSLFYEENTLRKVVKLIPVFRERLSLFRQLPIVGDVRSIGLVGAMELVKDRRTKVPYGFKDRMGQQIYREGLKNGLLMRPIGSVIYFYLPLCIKENQINFILQRAFNVIKKIGSKALCCR